MKPVITKFNDKTGDFEITIPVPFILKDGIEYVDMMVADIPKYEDIKDYNVFDLIRENQELKKQLENCYCNRTDCSSRIKDSKKYDSLVQKVENQQKEFIECLENEIEALEFCDNELILSNHKKEVKAYKEILLKYKEIIGKDINVSIKGDDKKC